MGEYFETYGDTQARSVEVKPAPSWLGGQTRGVALSTVAPAQVFSLPVGGRPRKIATREGVFKVRALGKPRRSRRSRSRGRGQASTRR